MSQPEFSVIIPTFNRKKELLECLDSLSNQSFPKASFEVIVVDDGSTDETGDAIKHKRFEFKLSYLKQTNAGPAQARNAGAGMAKATILAFTEDDVIVRPDWLIKAREAFERQDVEMLEGRTVYSGTDSDVRRFEPEQRPSFIPCNLFVKADVFKALGGYSKSYFDAGSGLYFREDADFGFRALASGHRSAIDRDVVVEHPVQFMSVKSCSRHVRRYVFDPLLYKRHPRQYRSLIEVKTIGSVTIRRPQHYVALVYGVAVIAAVLTLLTGKMVGFTVFLFTMFLCALAFRYKYRGKLSLDPAGIAESVKFVVLPLQYLNAFLRGCFKFRSFGALV